MFDIYKIKQRKKKWKRSFPFLLFSENKCSICISMSGDKLKIQSPTEKGKLNPILKKDLGKYNIFRIPLFNKGNKNKLKHKYVTFEDALDDPIYSDSHPFILEIYKIIEEATNLPACRIKSKVSQQPNNINEYKLQTWVQNPLGNDEAVGSIVTTRLQFYHDHVAFSMPRLMEEPKLDVTNTNRQLMAKSNSDFEDTIHKYAKEEQEITDLTAEIKEPAIVDAIEVDSQVTNFNEKENDIKKEQIFNNVNKIEQFVNNVKESKKFKERNGYYICDELYLLTYKSNKIMAVNLIRNDKPADSIFKINKDYVKITDDIEQLELFLERLKQKNIFK